jgi:ABC-type nickel/cobalt efflux system permease component RcnA
MIGAVLTYFFGTTFSESIFILTGIAAGNLLYIATADLIPELRESHKEHFYASFGATLVGSIIIAGLIMYTHGMVPHEEHDEDHAEMHNEQNEIHDIDNHEHDHLHQHTEGDHSHPHH